MPTDYSPELPAFAVSDEHPQWVVWCPWCEELHRHGPGEGHVTAHCWNTASPFRRTGYRLRLAGAVDRESAAHPKDFGVTYQPSLFHALSAEAKALRALFLRVVLGVTVAKSRRHCFTHRMPGRDRVVIVGTAWWIERRAGATVSGTNLLDLALQLHGVSAGVIAVRLIEASPIGRMDNAGALAVQAAVDAWHARGAPARDGRP